MGISDWLRRGKRKVEATAEMTVDLISIGGTSELSYLFIDVPTEDVLRAVDGWKWLPLQNLSAIAVSAFGEVFFSDPMGAIHQIDTIEGKLSKVANSFPELTAMLQDAEARDSLLFAGLVIGARDKGLMLESGECYDFKVAPVLGGQMGVDEMQKLSFVVKLHIAGQLHEQVKDLPPETRINKVTMSS